MKKSLLAIKNDIRKKEEIFKVLQKTYPYLAQLSEKQILAYFDMPAIDELNLHIKSMQSLNLCQNNFKIQDEPICSCTDSHGKVKDLYDSEESAQKEASVFIGQKKIQLKAYLCPNGNGWHLTKG